MKRFIALLIACALLLPGDLCARRWIPKIAAAAGGTVTYDAVSSSTGSTASGDGILTTLTYGMTVTSGLTNPYLVVSVGLGFGSNPVTVSSVTYDGSAMTAIGSTLVGASGHGRQSLYGIIPATAGTSKNIVVTVSPAPAVGEVIVSGAVSFSRVNATTPYSNATTASGNSATAAVTVTSATSNMVIAGTNGGSNYTVWQATDRWHNNSSQATGGGCAACSSAVGSASVTMSWTLGSDSWAAVGCSLNHD